MIEEALEVSAIQGYHVHVYFDESTFEKAQEICQRVSEKFDIAMGTLHKRCVGPHPMWSCQLSVEKGKFGRVIPWMMKNREGLTIFTHAITGDDYIDHTAHTLWMGSMPELKLDIFNR